MRQGASLIGLLAVFLLSTPAAALTAKEKLKTCTLGATIQKLTGPAKKEFIKKCLADEDASPSPSEPQPK